MNDRKKKAILTVAQAYADAYEATFDRTRQSEENARRALEHLRSVIIKDDLGEETI